VARTSPTHRAGGFVITAEESVSKGIRRIVVSPATPRNSRKPSRRSFTARSIKRARRPNLRFPALSYIQKTSRRSRLPLREKTKSPNLVTELQAKYKSWEKNQQVSAGGSGANAAEAANQLLAAASELAVAS